MKAISIPRAIFYGALTAGTLDLIDAFVFFGMRSGSKPVPILHSIAAGFVGRDAARAGGIPTAILGVIAHYSVALGIVTVYILASRMLPVLKKQWFLCGIVFGVAAYFVMTWVVVPLSNAGGGSITLALPVRAVMLNGILIHAFGVGLPAAYFASKAR